VVPGAIDGAWVGATEGAWVVPGAKDGAWEGATEGAQLGAVVGATEGASVLVATENADQEKISK
jgi:hypothetical protein